MAKALSPDKLAFSQAIEKVGSQSALADLLTTALGVAVSQQWVSAVLNRGQKVPAEWCAPIEKATKVARHQLRPDVFGARAGAAA